MYEDTSMRELFCRPADERAVLAFCMRDIENYFTVCSKLEANDFLYAEHELLMLLFYSLASKGSEKFDTELVIAEATAGGILENIGGPKYIQTISNVSASQENFSIHLNSVVEAATKYKLYKLLAEKQEAIEKNARDGIPSADLLSSVEAEIMGLSMAGLNVEEPINLGDGLLDYIAERKENATNLFGMSTGYPILDKQIDGLVPGTLLVVAARKKMGKSTLLTNIALNTAYVLNKAVLYIDTEMQFGEWRPRALASLSGVKERDIKHGGFDEVTESKLIKWGKIIEKGKCFHEYMPGYSVDKLIALYKKYKYKEDIGLIVFDYLKEPDSSSLDRQRKEYQILGDVTTKIKDLAGQLNIPAITAVQLNRDNDVADSDRIARYADIVAHWGKRTKEEIDEGGYGCGTHKLEIRDTRRGGTTSEEGIGYLFFKEYLRIKEVPIDKQYFTQFEKTVTADSASGHASYEGYENEELS